MPTRRILELSIIATILTINATGTVKLWARKTLAQQSPGTITHGIAEVVVNVL